MKMTVEQAIKNAIKGKGITLDNAAKRLNMSRRTLYNHIGAAKIDPMFIQKVYTILKIDINQIIEDTTGPYMCEWYFGSYKVG